MTYKSKKFLNVIECTGAFIDLLVSEKKKTEQRRAELFDKYLSHGDQTSLEYRAYVRYGVQADFYINILCRMYESFEKASNDGGVKRRIREAMIAINPKFAEGYFKPIHNEKTR